MSDDPRLRILVVEDDPNLGLVLCDNLDDAGYRTELAAALSTARETMASKRIDLVVLDLMLPDGNGLDWCRELRAAGFRVPVLMLTARALESDLLDGFAAGADDYVTKPYRLRELLARAAALLRRTRHGPPSGAATTYSEPSDMAFPGFRFDLAGHRLLDHNDNDVALTSKEYGILNLFVESRDRALTRQEILTRVWGDDVVVDLRTIDNFVSSIKRKLGWKADSSFRIQTIRGIGYRMEWDDGS